MSIGTLHVHAAIAWTKKLPSKRLLLTAAKDDGTADIYVSPLRASTKPSPRWRSIVERTAEPFRGHPRVWLIGDAIHAMQANR